MEMEDHRVYATADVPPDVRAPPKKRRRIVISCTECHRRKQKCDRDLPCANCKARKKESACRYETNAPTAKERGQTSIDSSRPGHNGPTLPPLQSLAAAAANWGYSPSGGSTIGFLKKIESANGDTSLSASAPPTDDEHYAIKEQYKSLIRQLPAKGYIERLINIYFREFNHNYYPLDEDIFLVQLAEWNNLSFNTLSSSGPQGLSPDLRVFPALLFQVLGTALLILTDEPHEFYDHLKYAGSMSFEDLAADYSESGMSILNLLGKRHLTLSAVQTTFLRANFLKHVGKVTESWHAIGSAIKDAQEIGMHKDALDPQPASDSTEDILENQWLIQRRRRVYMVLMMWDVHCGVVLGRPGTIHWKSASAKPSMPIDAPIPKDRRKTPVVLRDEERDPPTPITKQLQSFKLLSPLTEVIELEQDGPCPKNYDKVDRIHHLISRLAEETPAYLRLINPDRRWDNHPDCSWWLQSCRFWIHPLQHFNFIALHRPYVFNRQESRAVALRASIDTLQAQMEMFQSMDSKAWRNFLLFFGSFDAVVLMASIYILFPKENIELASTALQQFQWTQERFEAIADRNRLANSARGVLQAIYKKFRKVIENQLPPRSSTSSLSRTPGSTADSLASARESVSTGLTNFDTSPPMDAHDMDDKHMVMPPDGAADAAYPPPQPQVPTDWSMPANFDFANMAPLFPMNDIITHDLNIVGGGMAWSPPSAPAHQHMVPGMFEGDFGGDSFWSLMNQYEPGPM
ncbi:Oleate activated transcription factor 3 like protein [Verticillium longisporum]|nr:Oleate activated transcription factor 3 like protein [Verticillium longisporum]